MARTAPVPNVPPLPGMCPGSWVLSAGGGAGGGGAGSGKGGTGKLVAGTRQGGGRAVGGGRNAGSCGPGSGAGCANPSHGNGGTAAGDPIDPMTGRVYTVATRDLALPGTIPLVLERTYSTDRLGVDTGLGWGWTHSLDWRLHERRRSLRLLPPDASAVEVGALAVGESVMLPVGKLRRHASSYTLEREGRLLIFAQAGVTDGGRIWHLSKVGNARGQTIALIYQDSLLTGIRDSVGRQIRVRRHPKGHIAAFEVHEPLGHSWRSFWRYDYDEHGDLVRATDALGNSHHYHYDERHRLLHREEPGGLVAEFVYDRAGRCVETWCHHPHTDWLDPGAPSRLADGHPAKGALHVRVIRDGNYAEVANSRSLQQLEGTPIERPGWTSSASGRHSFEYDETGNLVAYEDAVGSRWFCERNADGQPLALTGPIGETTRWERDEYGRVTAMHTPAGQTARYLRDEAGALLAIRDNLGDVVWNEYDSRGLLVRAWLPNGGETRMEYDALANRTAVIEPNGARTAISYDFFGRISGYERQGVVTTCQYDAMDRLVRVHRSDGGDSRFSYDRDGNLTFVGGADGTGTHLTWRLGVVISVVRPDGSTVRYLYDRELALTRILNAAGEEQVLERDLEGRVSRERTFDGRQVDYAFDEVGRVTEIREGKHLTELRYDAQGRLVERAYDDGRTISYAYDAVGRLLRVEDGRTSTSYDYDERGCIRQETTTMGAHVTTVTVTHDAMGHAAQLVAPAGVLDFERDVMGRVTSVSRGGRPIVSLSYDEAARTIHRLLPGGAWIEETVSTIGTLTRHRVTPPPRSDDTATPEPVASILPGSSPASHEQRWNWTPRRLLEREERNDGTIVEYVRDVNGRVQETRRNGLPVQAQRYDAADNLHEPPVARIYGGGGRLVSCGSIHYRYDDRGRVIERKGSGGATWQYEWRADDLLERAVADGRSVCCQYDGFGRLLGYYSKEGDEVVKAKRLQWWADTVVSEETEDCRTGTRSAGLFLGPPEQLLPMVEMRSSPGVAEEYRHILRNPQGYPVALVDDGGCVVSDSDVDSYGRGTPAEPAARLPGQWAIEELGLVYNRHRFFDPETAVFLTPEPLGVAASLLSYAFADNYAPEFVDPDGLVAFATTMTGPHGPGGGCIVTGMGRSQGGRDLNTLHPAVAAALPPNDAVEVRQTNSLGVCAEPEALSNHLRWWEERNDTARCNPPDPDWQTNLRSALGQLDPNGGIRAGTNRKTYAACENCGQMVARLFTLAGKTPPGSIIHPPAAPAGSAPARMWNPSQGFLDNPANAGFSGVGQLGNAADWPGAPATLGAWSHNGTEFVPQPQQPLRNP